MKGNPIYLRNGDDFDGYDAEYCDQCGCEVGNDRAELDGLVLCGDCMRDKQRSIEDAEYEDD